MYVLTNRQVFTNRTGLDAFGSRPNPNGPNELRIAEAEKVGGEWEVTVLPDHVDAASAKREGLIPRVDAQGKVLPIFASQLVAKRISDRLEAKDHNLLLFVHGYNNDLKAVLDRAQRFEAAFGVEVVVFSWPANGGGVVGTASYLSDKRDAQASVGALSRGLEKLADILDDFNRDRIKRIEAEATRRFSDDDERWNQFYTKMMEKGCPFTVNLALHSMGNYIYKHLLQSAAQRVDRLCFDNVVMVAADANNEGHAEWVDRIQCRNRVYVTINEDDSALRASRMKAGEEQKARLGHFPYNLEAQRATYVDFTGAPRVGDSHAYFEGKALDNTKVRSFFRSVFNGERAEEKLPFEPARKLYRCR